MKKRRLVIASILKPIDDSRMLEKIAVSLVKSGGFTVDIIGYPSKVRPEVEGVTLHPLAPFRRLSFSRLFSRFRVLRKVFAIKPNLLIVNTHELLTVAVVARLLLGTRIIYDIRENYFRNILYGGTLPPMIREVVALSVRLKEKLTSVFFHLFLLAEQGYASEMRFFGRRFEVVGNKAIVSGATSTVAPARTRCNLVFTGTLAQSTGVFEAIRLAKILHDVSPDITLSIIGYCAKASDLGKLKAAISPNKFITLTGGGQLVPHGQIMKALTTADFGIICYPPSPHTVNSIPTKLYEYLSIGLPIILQNHKPWVDWCAPANACIPVDFASIDGKTLLEQMRSSTFYTSPPIDVLWDSEEAKLLSALEKI